MQNEVITSTDSITCAGVARLLLNLIDAQRPFLLADCSQTPFDAKRVPAIQLEDYVRRILQYSGCTKATLVAALVFVDRILAKNPKFHITDFNVHRLLLSCIVSALKFYEDAFFTNSYYARVGGVSLEELNALEINMLTMIRFELVVSSLDYARYDAALTTSCAAIQAVDDEYALCYQYECGWTREVNPPSCNTYAAPSVPTTIPTTSRKQARRTKLQTTFPCKVPRISSRSKSPHDSLMETAWSSTSREVEVASHGY